MPAVALKVRGPTVDHDGLGHVTPTSHRINCKYQRKTSVIEHAERR